MKKRNFFSRRSLTALVAGMAMMLGVTGCGKEGEAGADGSTSTNESGLVYVADYLDVEGVDNENIVHLEEVDGNIHIVSAIYGETVQYKLVKLNMEAQSTTETMLETAADGYFNSVFFNTDGSLEAIESVEEYNEEDWSLISREIYLNQYDANGGLISSEEVSAKLRLEEDFYVSHFIKDAEGNYLIGTYEQPLMIYSPDLTKVGEVSGNYTTDGLCKTESGKVVASWWGNMGADVAVVSVAAQKMGPAIETNKSSGSATMWSGLGDTVLYIDGNNLCACDVVSGELTIIMDILAADVNPEYVLQVYPLQDGSYLMSYFDYSSQANKSELLLMKAVDPSTLPVKKELTIATIQSSQNLNGAVIEFNRSNEEYHIKVVDYTTEDYDYNAAVTNLQNDIVAGNVPDMIDVSSLAPWRNWAAKGILADLYPLMEADGELTKEELLPNIRNAYETDGALYVLPTTVSVNGIMVKSKFVQGVESLTPEYLLELESQLPEDADLFWYHYQGEVMYQMVYNNMSSYVDYQSGECYFDTDAFKTVLAYAKEAPAEWTETDGSLPVMLAEDKVIFYNQTIGQLPDWQFQKFVFGEDVEMLGYGDAGDGIKLMPSGCAFAITAQCEYKDAAWDFLKTFVSEEAQTGEYMYGIPVTQTGLDHFIYEAQHMEGTHGYGWDDVNVDITSATDEEVEEFLVVFEKADELLYPDTAISAIIEEEVKPYFEGQKSVDEVTEIIQSRVDIYLKENM